MKTLLAGAATMLLAATAAAGGFDTHDYAAALKQVGPGGLVNYKALKADPARLEAFIGRVATLDRKTYAAWSDRQKLAFWINAYNAWTLKAILGHYPVSSITKIPDAWKRLRFTAMGQPRSLDELEHQILRKQFDEPRIHFGLNCASIGCPVLRNEPYAAARLGTQLDEQVRVMLRDRSKFGIDRERKVVLISKLFDWYGKDFVPAARRASADRAAVQRAVLAFFGRYLGEAERAFLASGDYEVRYLDYDWALNEKN